MNKINVAIFSRDLGAGGIQKTLINILQILKDDVYAVDLFLFSKNVFFEVELPKNVTVHYRKQNALLSRIMPLFLYNFYFKKIKYNKQYDYAVDFDGFLNAQSAAAINAPAKHRIVWVHTDSLRLYRYYYDRPVIFWGYLLMHLAGRNRYKHFDTVVGVSSPILEPIKKRFPEKRYKVVPNGVSFRDIFSKSKASTLSKFDTSKYNLITVGRISHAKNYPQTIDKLAEILNSRDDIHYYIIGDGRDRRIVEKKIKKNSLGEKVTLLGATNNPYAYLRQADGFILNSRFEGQGIVLLEAKIFGLDLYYPERLSNFIPYLKQYRKDFDNLLCAKKQAVRNIDALTAYNKDIVYQIRRLFVEGAE